MIMLNLIDVIQAIIPEVLNAVGLLGIKLSMERLCFENGAIIVPSLNIQNSGDIEEVTASDVRKSHEKISRGLYLSQKHNF